MGIALVLSSSAATARADLVILKSGEMFRTPRAWKQDGGVYFQRNGRTVRIETSAVERLIHEPSPSGGGHPVVDLPAGSDSSSVPEPPAGDPMAEAGAVGGEVGYLGLAWGMPATQIDGLTSVGRDPAYGGVQEYIKSGHQPRFGRARVDRIVYGFWENGLYTIVVEVSNFLDFGDLKQEAVRRFGKGIRNRDDVEKVYWTDAVTDRLLAYDYDSDSGYLWMRSRRLHDRVRMRYPD